MPAGRASGAALPCGTRRAIHRVMQSQSEQDDMRAEIVRICADALRDQGHGDVTDAALLSDPRLAAAALRLLEDCRPLPVVVDLMADLRRIVPAA